MAKEIKVTACKDCPFCDGGDDTTFPFCKADDGKAYVEYYLADIPPTWCPLKTEPITVSLNV